MSTPLELTNSELDVEIIGDCKNKFEGKSLNLLNDSDHPIMKGDIEKHQESSHQKVRNTNVVEEIELLKSAVESPAELYSL